MTAILRALLIVAVLGAGLPSADDAYAAWSAGRPAESLPLLHQQAQARRTWDAWLDLGLCAAAAQRRGPAIVWLLEAYRLAPTRDEPRQALAALGISLPGAPLGVLGMSAATLPLALLAGLLLGYAAVNRRGRRTALVSGGLALALVVPGTLSAWLDGRHVWIGTANDTHLLDSTGTPLHAVAAGTLGERLPGATWNGRIAVRLSDGTHGWLAEADTQATP